MADKASLAAMGISDAPPPKVVETGPHFTSHAEDPGHVDDGPRESTDGKRVRELRACGIRHT